MFAISVTRGGEALQNIVLKACRGIENYNLAAPKSPQLLIPGILIVVGLVL